MDPVRLTVPDYATIPDAGSTGELRYDRRDGPGPLLVLIGGMTQTISSWSGQLRPLSKQRSVLAYEARGQGKPRLTLEDCGFARHVEDFAALVEALALPVPLDLCGFSFGGKVALAIAATRPDLVRRLIVTGVGLERGVVGRLIVAGWNATLATGDLEALARVSLTEILGPDFLDKSASQIDAVIRASMQRNTFEGIRALFAGTTQLADDSPWAPAALAPRVHAATLVLGGGHDRIAPPAEVAALAELLGGRHQIFADSGHTVPIEAALQWRTAVERFLQ